LLAILITVFTAFYSVSEHLINRLFDYELRPGEHFCALTGTHVGGVAVFAFVLALISSAVAAMVVARIEPGESLREE
jgi:ABC-type lipoprotein release transport system permease subunit